MVYVVETLPCSLYPRERYPAPCVPPNRSGWVRGEIFSLPNLHSESKYTRVSQVKTLNMFYLVIYWTQKVHNYFIFLCSIIQPPVGHSSNHAYHYVYWTVHRLDSWIKRDQLDVTCFIISLFNAQHVSGVNTSILSSLRLICWVIS